MRLRKRRTPKELCVFIALFLLIFVTIFHILLFSHSRTTTFYTSSDDGGNDIANPALGPNAPGNIARNALGELLTPEELQALAQGRDSPDKSSSYRTRKPPAPTPAPPAPAAQRVHNHQQAARGLMSSARARMRAMAQVELRKMEKSLTMLVRQNAPSPEESALRYRSETNAVRLKNMIASFEQRSSLYVAERNRTMNELRYNQTDDTRVTRESALRSTSSSRKADNPSAKVPSPPQVLSEPRVRANTPLGLNPQLFASKDNHGSEEYDVRNAVERGGEPNPKEVIGEDGEVGGGNSLEGGVGLGGGGGDREWNNTQDSVIEDFYRGRHQKQLCGAVSQDLAGETRDVHLEIEVDVDDIIKKHSDMLAGGEWKPQNCVSRHRLAIIIPYRDRWNHLKVLLHYVLPLLKRQQIHFRIFVVEQYGNQTFNKGRIMNAAYREALKVFDFQCVIFHDVDLVPEDDRNIYTCSEHPMHMSTAIDKFNYHLPYMGLVGGVLSFRVDHFQLVNGYSNMYWGWGGEDDDMTTRILSKGLRIFRPPNNIARYKMVKHSGRSVSSIRLKLLRTAARRGRVEGLNNVPYQLMFIHLEKLFTHLMVDVGKP